MRVLLLLDDSFRILDRFYFHCASLPGEAEMLFALLARLALFVCDQRHVLDLHLITVRVILDRGLASLDP